MSARGTAQDVQMVAGAALTATHAFSILELMAEQFGFAGDEWDLMQEVPLDIYLCMLQVDVAVDSVSAEHAALTLWLDTAALACSDTPWMRAAIDAADRPTPAQARGASVLAEADLTAKLAQLSSILDQRVTLGEARAFKRLLLSLAEQVAAASGGPFPGAPRVTQAESDLLWKVRSALGI